MAYLIVEDFAAGIDRRKSFVSAPAGTLRTLDNAIVTNGGEIEKRKALSSVGVLPTGQTKGLAFRGGNLYVFGTAPAGTVGVMPDNVLYRQLSGTASVLADVLDVQVFAGKFYVVARDTNGNILHFYDGTLVPDTEVQGTATRAHKAKMHAVDGTNLRISAIKDATDWTTGAGNEILDVTVEDADASELVGLEEYYGALALFARNSVQIWDMDPDPALNSLRQILGNIGLIAPRAVTRYGSGDVLFLSQTGIRSLRARDINGSAAVNDLGSPVDRIVAALRAALTPAQAEKITALVDPLTGHFWLAWGDRVLILADHGGSKVSAWSTFTFGYEIDNITQANSRIAIRSGEQVFVYGAVEPGANPFDPNLPLPTGEAQYDASPVEVVTPFMDAGRPAAVKQWAALDMTCSGEWIVYACPDAPGDEDTEPAWTQIAIVGAPTWPRGRIPIDMASTHLALRFVSTGSGSATIASFVLHHDLGDEG